VPPSRPAGSGKGRRTAACRQAGVSFEFVVARRIACVRACVRVPALSRGRSFENLDYWLNEIEMHGSNQMSKVRHVRAAAVSLQDPSVD
jgi:hypothetical protein